LKCFQDDSVTLTASIIVPTFRREEALCEMLRTLLAQDFDDFEILLIDQTPEHCEETISFLNLNADRIERVWQETPNLPMARNRGLSLARGRFIIYIDDDVLLPNDCVGKLARHLAEEQVDGVSGLISFEKSREDVRQQYEKQYGAFNKCAPNGLLFVHQFIGAVMAFRREVFDEIGGFDELLGVLSPSAAGEDNEFCRRAKRGNFRLAIDTTLTIDHPLGVRGGCAAREVSIDVARMRQMKSTFYIEMKFAERHGKIGLQGWVRMLRGWAINRGMLKQGVPSILGRLQELEKNYKTVQEFFRKHAT
jgi:glycosyltransferase involved in cell wall biosynthesis